MVRDQQQEHKVVVVPGQCFDVNPRRGRRPDTQFKPWVRFSFGPPLEVVTTGLDRLQAMIEAASKKEQEMEKEKGTPSAAAGGADATSHK